MGNLIAVDFEKKCLKYEWTEGIKAYCDCCAEFTLVESIDTKMDDLNFEPWADLLCSKCHFIIATFQTEQPGRYELTKKDS